MHEKKAFSVVPKASPWRPNHVTICLLRHSGQSLQNGQLELRRRNWHFARETHKDTAVSVWACQAGFLKRVPEHRVSFEANPMRYSTGFAKSHSLKCSLHKWAWCGTARKSARLNCINLIHFRLSAGRLRGNSCIVIPGVVCVLLQFAATQRAGIVNFFVDHTHTQFTEESKMATAPTPQTDVTSGKSRDWWRTQDCSFGQPTENKID